MRKEIKEHECTPDWYGVAWVDMSRNIGVCYPIPVNFIMGWGRCFLVILKRGPAKLIYRIERWLDSGL